MNAISILLILFIGLFVGWAMYSGARRHAGTKRWAAAIGYGLIALGGLGFFGGLLSGTGGLRWLPSTFEWPVGTARGVLVMPDGRRVVPHTWPSRIQVYDTNWKFLRGWYVDAGGGVFLLRLAGANQVEVITARKQMRYVYKLDGSLLSRETYAGQKHSYFFGPENASAVPTRWWLWMFTDAAYSWIVFALGGAMLFVVARIKSTANGSA